MNSTRGVFQDGEPGSWAGNPDKVCERFRYYIDMDFDFFQVMFPGFSDDYVETSRRFAERVMKKIWCSWKASGGAEHICSVERKNSS